VNASEEFLGQRDDDARRASHVAESVLVLVLGHLADEFGAVGAQAKDRAVDAFDVPLFAVAIVIGLIGRPRLA